jgi:hypothetical protein
MARSAAPSSSALTAQLEPTMRRYFGHGDFRPQQKDIIEAILSKRDVFVGMATGAGKSMCAPAAPEWSVVLTRFQVLPAAAAIAPRVRRESARHGAGRVASDLAYAGSGP